MSVKVKKNKVKGSNAERELLFMLFDRGFVCSRVAGSGSSSLPTPDIIALKDKKVLAIECKTKSGKYLNISEAQVEELFLWEKISKYRSFIAWRLGKDQWYFLETKDLNKTPKAYAIKRDEIMERGLILDDFIPYFLKLK